MASYGEEKNKTADPFGSFHPPLLNVFNIRFLRSKHTEVNFSFINYKMELQFILKISRGEGSWALNLKKHLFKNKLTPNPESY